MRRTAPEEWNLAVNYHEQDVTVAEFIRTYMSIVFNGHREKSHPHGHFVSDHTYLSNPCSLLVNFPKINFTWTHCFGQYRPQKNLGSRYIFFKSTRYHNKGPKGEARILET